MSKNSVDPLFLDPMNKMANSENFYYTLSSPVGDLTLVANHEKLLAILWDRERDGRVKLPKMERGYNEVLLNTERELSEYFSCSRTLFTLPIYSAGTAFQQAVWQTLLKIPYGATWSYREVAEAIGLPRAVRAVGAAIGSNPLSIVIPCHRVIGTNGKLIGFAGGVARKRFLLEMEGSLKEDQ